jgi:hypothetical protein
MFKAHKQICFIVNYADFEGESFLMWGRIEMAIRTVNEMGEVCWFFILMLQVGKTFVILNVLSEFHHNLMLTNNV